MDRFILRRFRSSGGLRRKESLTPAIQRCRPGLSLSSSSTQMAVGGFSVYTLSAIADTLSRAKVSGRRVSIEAVYFLSSLPRYRIIANVPRASFQKSHCRSDCLSDKGREDAGSSNPPDLELAHTHRVHSPAVPLKEDITCWSSGCSATFRGFPVPRREQSPSGKEADRLYLWNSKRLGDAYWDPTFADRSHVRDLRRPRRK